MTDPRIQEVLGGGRRWTVAQGDNREVLKHLPDESVDAVVTDPPGGIEFMGKSWDRFEHTDENPSGQQTEEWDDKKGRDPFARGPTPRYQGKTKESLLPFQDFIADVFTEVYRVMKPGAHALVWALPRTSHHTMMGLERVGFEIRDVITHHFGQGFPKSMDISKALDKAARGTPQGAPDPESPHHGKYKTQATEGKRGAGDNGKGYGAGPGQFVQRPVVGRYTPPGGKPWKLKQADDPAVEAAPGTFTASGRRTLDITAPVTEDAKKWNGWGTALKPSTEFWILVRKPISEGNVAANVVKHGTGGINIDGSRVVTAENLSGGAYAKNPSERWDGSENWRYKRGQVGEFQQPIGRFPANLILSHAPGCELRGTKKVPAPVINQWEDGAKPFGGAAGHPYKTTKTGDENGMEEIEDWVCATGCPVAELDAQGGELTSGKEPAAGFVRHAPEVPEGIYGGGKGLWNKEQEAGILYGDTGGASRFFKTFGPPPVHPFAYFPKADRAEREAGLESLKKNKKHVRGPMAGRGQPGLKCKTCGKWKASGNPCQCAEPDWEQVPFERPDIANVHPTVKSVDLMSWLCKMVTPPDGVVLDPFCGSGSTGIAALKQGFRFIGIEREPEYVEISRRRIEGDAPLFNLA